ncbi:hypothetical protein STEG23_017592 [Scotinomys teguina]
MYLFLSNLSFSDLCFSSVTMPKLLQNMQSQDPSITYGLSDTNVLFLNFGTMESFLLTVMAYDRVMVNLLTVMAYDRFTECFAVNLWICHY